MSKRSVVFAFDTIEMAFEYASFDNEVYLDRHTGKSIYLSPDGDADEEPEDLDDDTRYVAVPNKSELDLGSRLAIEFTAKAAPLLLDDVREAFRGRGGFRRFKDLLDRHHLLDAWHEYQADQERTALMQWCNDNDIRYTLDTPGDE